MRESLKNLSGNQVILEDNTIFYYIIKPYELKNPLGNIVVVLQEYNFTKEEDTDGAFTCKLYKTKEDNWYDLEEDTSMPGKALTRMLKASINEKETNPIPAEAKQ